MKKMMALLLACLLCLCAAGAMAEKLGTLNLDDQEKFKIYPDGYMQNGFFVDYTGPYIIKGTSDCVNTCLDFYSIPHEETEAKEPVTYTVTFQGISILTDEDCTALRFGCNEGAEGKDITLNLINCGYSEIEMIFSTPNCHPVFSNQGDQRVYINLHNAESAKLSCLSGKAGIDAWRNAGVTLKIEGAPAGDSIAKTIAAPDNRTFQHVDATQPVCKDGVLEHWVCPDCGMLFFDKEGKTVTTAADVTLPAQHDIEKVPAKEATYEQDGNIEHYRCKRCGALFSDANETQELTANDVVLAKLVRTDTLPQTDDLPQTGDSSRLTGWLALLGACCAGIWCLNRRRG